MVQDHQEMTKNYEDEEENTPRPLIKVWSFDRKNSDKYGAAANHSMVS